MKRSKTTLVQKLFGYYFALSLVTIIILSLYSYFTSKNALISRTYDQLTSVKFEKERNIENYFLERMDEVNQICLYENWEGIIKNTPLYKTNKMFEEDYKSFILSEYEEKIAKYLGEKINFKNIIIQTDSLQCIIQLKSKITTNDISFPVKNDTLFNYDLKEFNYSNRITMVEDLINKKIYLRANLRNNSITRKEGLILFEMEMTSINSIMFNTNVLNGLGKTGEAYAVGSDRIMLTSSRFKSNSINKQLVKTLAVDKAFHNLTGTGKYKDYRDITVLGSYGKINIPGLNWVILV